MIVHCPECNAELKCMVVLGADQTLSGQTERLFLCEHCLSSWEVVGELYTDNLKIRRYFFG